MLNRSLIKARRPYEDRLETITHVEVILLVILGAILFKKMS